MPQNIKLPWEEDQPRSTRTRDAAAAATRGASGVIPAAIRVVSGLGSGTGGAIGFGVSGAGEVLAQLIEDGKINLPRVLGEATIGAIPGAKLVKVGSMLKSGAAGAALGGAGAAMRGLTPNEGEERSLDPASIASGAAIGGTAGAAVGKIAGLLSGKKGGLPGVLEDTLKKQPQDKAPVLVKKAPGLRVGTAPSGEPIRATGAEQVALRTHDSVPPVVREAEHRAGAAKPEDVFSAPAGLPKLSDVDQAIDAAANISKAQRTVNDKGDKAFQKRVVGKEKAAAQGLAIQKKEAAQKSREERNAFAMIGKESEEAAAARRIAEIKEGATETSESARDTFRAKIDGGTESGSVSYRAPKAEGGAAPRPLPNRITPDERRGLAAMTPERAAQMLNRDLEGMVKSGELLKEGNNYRINPDVGRKPRARTTAGGEIPKEPVVPKPGVYQVVRPDGRVIEVPDAEAANALKAATGEGTVVVPPSDLQPPPAPPKAPRFKGTAGQVVDQQDAERAAAAKAAVGAPPKTADIGVIAPDEVTAVIRAPETSAAPPAAPKGPMSAISKLQELGYTPEDMGKLSAKEADAIIKAGARKDAFAPLTPKPAHPASPQADVPAGSTIARFFPTKDAALKAAAIVEEQPNDPVIGKIWELLGLGETGRMLQRGHGPSGVPRAEETTGPIWKMLGQLTKEQNLPSMPPGAQAKPNFKHVPEDIRPKPAAAVPVVDVAPKGRTYFGKKSAEAVAAKAARTEAAQPASEAPPTDRMAAWPPPPAAPKTPTFPPITEGKPLPPDLQMQIQTVNNQMKILSNSGRQDTEEYMKLVEEAANLQQQAFAAQYPELVAELAKAEQAAKAAPKTTKDTKGPRKGPETGEVEIGGLLKMAMPAAGAAIGGATYEEDPLLGAILGAGAGFGGAKGIEALASSGKPLIHIDQNNPKDSLLRLLSGFQRFNYLTDPLGLTYNSTAAPFGAGVLGSLERAAVGKAEQLTGADPNASDKVQEGVDMLRGILSKQTFEPENIEDAWNKANRLIGTYERAEELPEESLDQLRVLFTTPGRLMGTGDVVIREALMRAGVSEDIARAITVTSNPRYKYIGEKIVNWAKDPAGSLTLPFSRTAANVLEGGLERTPFIGFMLTKTNDPAIQATYTEMVTRQGLGAGMWYLGYLAGSNIDPNLDEKMQLRKLIVNMSGQYGLPVAAGYAAGQAVQLGRIDDTLPQLFKEGIKSYGMDYPLPTTRAMVDIGASVGNYLEGQPAHPNAEEFSRRWFPYSTIPGIVPVVERFIADPEEALRLPWE